MVGCRMRAWASLLVNLEVGRHRGQIRHFGRWSQSQFEADIGTFAVARGFFAAGEDAGAVSLGGGESGGGVVADERALEGDAWGAFDGGCGDWGVGVGFAEFGGGGFQYAGGGASEPVEGDLYSSFEDGQGERG